MYQHFADLAMSRILWLVPDGVPLRATSYGRGIFLGTQWSEDAESEEARLVPCWVNPKSAESIFFAGWFLINPCFLLVETPYPLVNVYITMERSTIFIGKIHELNGGSFHSYVTNYQRVSLWLDNPPWRKDDSDKVNFSSWYNHEE